MTDSVPMCFLRATKSVVLAMTRGCDKLYTPRKKSYVNDRILRVSFRNVIIKTTCFIAPPFGQASCAVCAFFPCDGNKRMSRR